MTLSDRTASAAGGHRPVMLREVLEVLNPRAGSDELPQLARSDRPAANKGDEPSGQIQEQRQQFGHKNKKARER